MNLRCLLLAPALLCAGIRVSAQFVTYGDDPGRLRWRQERTDAFRLIRPEGADSLGATYLRLLEQYRPVVGASLGMAPGEFQWGRTPIILHTHHPYSNGAVTWAPRRMDLYTVQDPYASDPTPWPVQLTVHESRHVAQMQFGYRKPLLFGQYLAGEMWHGLLDGLFVDMPVFEGDAVVAETALTRTGRARTADFLGFYPVAFDAGDWRDWYQWRYGSFKRAAPDYYTTGFMTFAGMRVFYDRPAFSEEYFDGIVRRPVPYKNLQRAMSRVSGESFPRTWRHIQQEFHALWRAEAEERAPFDPIEQITETPEFETDYEGFAVLKGALYAIKHGKTLARRLVRLEPDEAGGAAETDCGPFAAHTSGLSADAVRERLYWSETVDDRRWGLSGVSRIRYREADGSRQDLTKEGRFYNPAPSPDGRLVAAVEYPYAGGSRLVVLEADGGAVHTSVPAPSGVQLTEPEWLDGRLYALGIADDGFGIWRFSEGGWKQVLAPSVQKIQLLQSDGERLTYVSDRNGVNEWYAFDPESGATEQLTNTRYGGMDFVSAGEVFYFSSYSRNGRMVFRSAFPDLRPKTADPLRVHAWTVADALSEQERKILEDKGLKLPEVAPGPAAADGASSEPYRKAGHLLHFHSWLPLYFNYDAVESLSFDFTYHTASLGATGFFQNDLGTASGFVGYSAHKDPHDKEHWRHSLHGRFTYSGLYPVFEASWSLNDRAALRYVRRKNSDEPEAATYGFLSQHLPVLSGSLRAYLPLKFNKDGVLRGLVPQLNWSFGNDAYSTGRVYFDTEKPFGLPRPAAFTGHDPGVNVPFQTLTASLRGYAMLATASSQTYPRLGIGAEAGAQFRPAIPHLFSPNLYAYVYGYLPGFRPEQGLRLSASSRILLNPAAEIPYLSVSTFPRGYTSTEALAAYGNAPFQIKATADYALPLYFGDISALSPFVYIRNFLLIPHADFSIFSGERTSPESDRPVGGTLWSAGFDLTAETGNLLWLPFDGSIGLTVNLLGGSAYGPSGAERYHVGALFNMDF